MRAPFFIHNLLDSKPFKVIRSAPPPSCVVILSDQIDQLEVRLKLLDVGGLAGLGWPEKLLVKAEVMESTNTEVRHVGLC